MRADRDASTRRPARVAVAELDRAFCEWVDARKCSQLSHEYLRSKERIQMSSPKRSLRNLSMLVPLACLTGVLGLSVMGCSRGDAPFTLSPEAKTKSQEVWKTKSQEFGERINKKS